MKRKSLLRVGFASLLLLAVAPLFGREEALKYVYRVVETFNDEGGSSEGVSGFPIIWKVRGGKTARENFPKLAYASKSWPVALFGVDPTDADSLQVLGVHADFVTPGYNVVEIIPGREVDGEWKPEGVPLPGRVKMVDFWFWSPDRPRSTLEVHFRDYKGMIHRVNAVTAGKDRIVAGSLGFKGWRNLFVDVTPSVAQGRMNDPGFEPLKLERLVLRTHPTEFLTNFYVYVDELRVFTNTSKAYYDGYQLTSPGKIKEIWGEPQSQGSNEIEPVAQNALEEEGQ